MQSVVYLKTNKSSYKVSVARDLHYLRVFYLFVAITYLTKALSGLRITSVVDAATNITSTISFCK